MREVEQFNAVELAEADDAVIHKQDFTLWGTFALQGKDVHFEETQTLVGDNQEVATTTGRIKELHLAHALQQGITFLLYLFTFFVELFCSQRANLLHLPLLFVQFV